MKRALFFGIVATHDSYIHLLFFLAWDGLYYLKRVIKLIRRRNGVANVNEKYVQTYCYVENSHVKSLKGKEHLSVTSFGGGTTFCLNLQAESVEDACCFSR